MSDHGLRLALKGGTPEEQFFPGAGFVEYNGLT